MPARQQRKPGDSLGLQLGIHNRRLKAFRQLQQPVFGERRTDDLANGTFKQCRRLSGLFR